MSILYNKATTLRHLLLGLFASMGAGLMTSLLLMLLIMTIPGQAHAGQEDDAQRLTPAEVTRGTLLLKGEIAGKYQAAPLVHTDVDMRISGLVARTKVVQRFTNPSQDWVEGVYVFPLPENAAVDHLRMRIGERLIEGQIKERQQAKKIYQQAKRSGRKAALIEQERANIFTNSVANIGPGETVQVEIEYQQSLRYEQGGFEIRFPMVVAPRYIPGSPLQRDLPEAHYRARAQGTGWAMDTDQVSDASRITPPVPRQVPANPVSLRVELDAGFAVAQISSPYHQIDIEQLGKARHLIRLAQGTVPAERDFVLQWQPLAAAQPHAALFSQTHGAKQGENYYLLMVMPPVTAQDQVVRTPRESIFVIDTSGSMGGDSIRQAKKALLFAIERLQAQDRFNIIQFNSTTTQLFPSAIQADPQHLQRARDYVNGLQAGGGTEMARALQRALDGQRHKDVVRQVIFLTDGAVGNEDYLFNLIKARLGDSRLFTVGIGAAPNSHFMTKAAQYGRGSFTYIGKPQEVAERMRALFSKLESPVAADIQVSWPDGSQAEVYPQRLPDLYLGEPLLISARSKQSQGDLVLSGRIGRQPWRVNIPLAAASKGQGLGVVWARRKIADLMDQQRAGKQVKQQIIEVALAHHLVSRYTSLVAVDVTPSRAHDQHTKTRAVASRLPAGWQHDKVFGRLPKTATAWPLQALSGGLLVLMALMLLGRHVVWGVRGV